VPWSKEAKNYIGNKGQEKKPNAWERKTSENDLPKSTHYLRVSGGIIAARPSLDGRFALSVKKGNRDK